MKKILIFITLKVFEVLCGGLVLGIIYGIYKAFNHFRITFDMVLIAILGFCVLSITLLVLGRFIWVNWHLACLIVESKELRKQNDWSLLYWWKLKDSYENDAKILHEKAKEKEDK